MSDTSDDDLVPHNFQPENTGFYTQLSKPNYGSYNNMMNSNFNMPNRFMAFDQRSMYSRRETSPMSLRSFPNSRMQYQQSNPQSAMSFRGSVNNARCRSPMSVRSICSNTTVSAVDIALALKNYKFNKNDERMINEAYNTFKKSQMRKRIAKRRNLKFLKFCRRNLDGESGAEGSNSSLSSDDCRSTRSAVYTRNMPKAVARPPRMDLNKFTTQVRENNNYTDCTENFRQNSFRNLLTTHSRNVNHSFMPHDKQQNVTYDNRYPKVSETRKDQCSESQSASVVTLKDRLAKDTSLLLPIQRFNMSNVNPTYEISYKVKSKTAPQKESASNNRIEESDIESEEILPPSTSRGNLTHSNTLQKKRALETENISYPESKRKKLTTSPVKQNKIASSERMKRITTNTKKDFNFKKPLLPVRKFGTLMRDNEPEILIAKSTQPLVGNVEPLSNLLKETPQIVISEEKSDTNKHTKQPSQNHVDTTNNNTVADTMYNSTNVSIKPSFTKRKLFTQTLDIVENNVSNDNSGVDSPQTKTLRTCREKNKVRKLTSQSCLSRDVSDNNFMDLLHKFLPPDQKKNQTQNNTNVTNKKEASKCTQMKDKKWDVNLAISLTDMDDISETFTDEEIFNALEKDKGKTKQVNKDSNKGPDLADVPKKNQKAPASVCKATLQKTKETPSVIGDYTELSEKQYPKRRTVKSFVKSFWDTDFESDMEDIVTQTSQKNLEKDPIPSGSQFLMNGTNKIGAKKKPMDTTLPVRNPSKLGITQSIQSDDTQKLKSKMLDTNQQENKENINENKLNKSTRSRSKSNKANIQTEKTTNNKSDTNKVSNKANNQKNQQKPKPRTASSKRNNTPSQSIFNISRQSLRQGQASSNNSTSTNGINSPEVESHKCNTSRASMRLKQKREASLSNSSANNTNSPEDQSHKNNTSRASMRLKQKRIAKLNNSFTNHTMSSENESDKCNTCKLNGNKRRVNLK
ncbi:biorientation of chromosomes in cell division protein 1-like 1 isoform X2 [Maniola jurtina]|uniref:biorientation of chromosomes in cell division protein 1-like 1 isoform X2 n=1 Tax=Maniola jurtina TaxID=191418 RepID=UPI001E68ED77|nr:biorientation of chromosomes in cell division protein 1-like 1 isoform X2 [Maniola jurtina]